MKGVIQKQFLKLLADPLNILSASTQKMQFFCQRKVINEPALPIHRPSQDAGHQHAPACTARWETVLQPHMGVSHTQHPHSEEEQSISDVLLKHGPGWDTSLGLAWLWSVVLRSKSLPLTALYHHDLSMCTKTSNTFCQSRINQNVSNSGLDDFHR